MKTIKQKDYIKEYFYIVALAVLFCLVVSIISYDPNDPSTFHRLSNSEQKISNYFGPFGASLADWSFQIFGLGTIIFLIIFIVQLIYTFRRPITKTRFYLKIFGYPQLIFFYLGFISGIKPLTNFRGIQVLTGGVLGNKIFELFSGIFETNGALIVLFLGALTSLTLCIGIKPLSSVLWFLRLTPAKYSKGFTQNITSNSKPVIDDLFDAQTSTEENLPASILYRADQNVFLDLISVLESDGIGSFKNILQSKEFQRIDHLLPLICGKPDPTVKSRDDTNNTPMVLDLANMPNLLVEGEVGSEKNNTLNIFILSLMLNKTPSEIKLVLIDPQMLEFYYYDKIGHLLTPIITSAHKCLSMFEWLIDEIERRYLLFKQVKVRNFTALKNIEPLPYIVVIISELHDLMVSIPYELEAHLQKFSFKAHLVGIHLIFATQKPSANILTDSIQSNFSSRLHLYQNKMTFISDVLEGSVQTDIISISPHEIQALTDRLRSLYPFSSENITMK